MADEDSEPAQPQSTDDELPAGVVDAAARLTRRARALERRWDSLGGSSPPDSAADTAAEESAGGPSAEESAGGPSAEESAGGPCAEESAGGPSAGESAGGPSAGESAGGPSAGESAGGPSAEESAGGPSAGSAPSGLPTPEQFREQRDALLDRYDFVARVRAESDGDVLVCHPAEWLEDGVVDPEGIESVDRAIERPLAGTGEPEDWEAVARENDEIAERVAAEHGQVHGETARALAAFASNHYAKPIPALTAGECEEFLAEYFPRNAWPSDAQRDRSRESVRLAFAVADATCPL